MLFSSWTKKISSRDSNEFLLGLAHRHMLHIKNEAVREVIADLLNRRDFPGLCDYDLPYSDLSPDETYHCRQILSFFGKRDDIDCGQDRRATAELKFIEAEALCRETNMLFRKRARGEFLFSPRVEAVLFTAQRKVAHVLGAVPHLSELKLRFGPGATTQLPKRTASPRSKLGQEYACSEDFADILKDVLEEMPSWLPETDQEVVEVPVVIHDGKLVFVPKNARTDRSVIVEPALNQMVQLGVGDYMAKRLRPFGIDIRDQTVNQRLAREGSLTGALATLDLSSASDTIATELVYELLPVDWANFLSCSRTSNVQLDGFRFSLEKFSAMGNGYTFPLETLIFWALSVSCLEVDGVCSVYGDDIIISVESVPLLEEVFRSCGFLFNKKKSFTSGPFRESCGKDYHSGFDVRPCYIKTALSCRDLFRLHNFYERRGLEDFAYFVLAEIPEFIRLWGPDGYGDGHLLGGPPLRPCNRDKGWCGYIFDTYTFVSPRSFRIYANDRVLPFYSIYSREPMEWPGRNGGDIIDKFSRLSDSTSTIYDKKGNLGVTLPGTEKYKRISIYTLTR